MGKKVKVIKEKAQHKMQCVFVIQIDRAGRSCRPFMTKQAEGGDISSEFKAGSRGGDGCL